MTETKHNSISVAEQAALFTGSGDARIRAGALSSLCALTGTKEGQTAVLHALGGTEKVVGALRSGEPKERKNAARLLSAIGTDDAVAALEDALSRERTLFVIPSLLLALGAVGGEEAKRVLLAYEVPDPASEEEKKHIALIAEAKNKALSHAVREAAPGLHRLYRPAEMLLIAPAGFRDTLLRELDAAGLTHRTGAEGVFVTTNDLDKLFKQRCFYEALIPCGVTACSASEIARAARSGWELLCAPDSMGAPKLPYRVELKNAESDRGTFIRDLWLTIGGRNDPSAYSFEIRVKILGDGRASVYVKPCTVRDVRFTYRKGKLPASIHPVTAAALVSEALNVLQFPAGRVLRVYDPCCGSGTLLIEAARAFKGKTVLMGTDIMQNAVTVAKENTAAALTRAVILKKDCLKFRPGEPFDLIVSNLPFGNRVGDHKGNTALYRGLVSQLPALMADGGLAALYTTEGTLLSEAIKDCRGLSVVRTVRTEAGGLMPTVFFIKKETNGDGVPLRPEYGRKDR